MQLVIRTSATARGRMLPQSHWRLKTVAQRPSLPVRQPPYDADFFSLFSNGGIVRGTEAKPLAVYRRRLCCLSSCVIGVRDGDGLQLTPECLAINPTPSPKLIEGGPKTAFAVATSDVFFERPENRVRAQGFGLAVIDGDHSFAQTLDWPPRALRDSDDVIPKDARTATPLGRLM
jgi:hypothetical protein